MQPTGQAVVVPAVPAGQTTVIQGGAFVHAQPVTVVPHHQLPQNAHIAENYAVGQAKFLGISQVC